MSDYEKLLREERARAADEGHGHTVQAIDRVLRLAVPASDPRALALEEAANEADKIASEFSGHGLTAECAASVLVAARIRALSGSESPRPAGKVLACSMCGWTAEPCQHIGAWLERHGPVNEREGAESPRAEGAGRHLAHLAALRLDATAVPSSAVLPLSGVPIGTVLLALIEEVEASRRAGRPVETGSEERDA